MEILIYVVSGALLGTFIGWFAADAQSVSAIQAEKDVAAQRFSALEKEFAEYRATIITNQEIANASLHEKSLEIDGLKRQSNTRIKSSVAE